MMWTGVLSAAVWRRTSCSKKGTSAPGCWKAFCAESARYSSILRCAAARVAGVGRRSGGPFGFLLGRFLFRGGRLRGGSLGRTGQQAAAHEGRAECQENPVAHHSSVVGNAATGPLPENVRKESAADERR